MIHPTAIIHPGANLGANVSVGPYSIIGEHVEIGDNTSIAAHVVISGHTRIGCDNRIFQFCSIGASPQDKKYDAEPTRLEIGDRNTIREFCTLNLGTTKEEGVTRIGSDNWIMAYVHIAHDCRVGDHVVMANAATLAGHVHIGDWVVIGGLTGVHQFVHVGAHAMVGFQAHVAQDVPPFMTVDGNPLAARAINLVGLRRRDFGPERIDAIKRMHALLYRQGLTLEQAKTAIAALADEAPAAAGDVATMSAFLAASTRGIVR